MIEPRGEVNLAKKSVGTERNREIWVKNFERDDAIVLDILCQVNRRHSAATELAIDRVG